MTTERPPVSYLRELVVLHYGDGGPMLDQFAEVATHLRDHAMLTIATPTTTPERVAELERAVAALDGLFGPPAARREARPDVAP